MRANSSRVIFFFFFEIISSMVFEIHELRKSKKFLLALRSISYGSLILTPSLVQSFMSSVMWKSSFGNSNVWRHDCRVPSLGIFLHSLYFPFPFSFSLQIKLFFISWVLFFFTAKSEKTLWNIQNKVPGREGSYSNENPRFSIQRINEEFHSTVSLNIFKSFWNYSPPFCHLISACS